MDEAHHGPMLDAWRDLPCATYGKAKGKKPAGSTGAGRMRPLRRRVQMAVQIGSSISGVVVCVRAVFYSP
jgi:hypothetical protein